MDKEFWMSYKGLMAVLMTCVVLFGIGYSLTWLFKEPNNAGDTAGLVNGMFSALAFAGVIYAIFLQRNELELQRDELRDTRIEFQQQNETMKLQRFENTFFNMLQLQQQITDNISYSYKDKRTNSFIDLKGREVFFQVFERITHFSSDYESHQGMRGLIEAGGLREYEENYTPSYFDHYFRHLYRIFKFIDGSQLISKENRYEYAAIVRAQLSRYELIWLYYNSLSIYGKEKFKPLIEKYALLKNLREDLLVICSDMNKDYNGGAFEHDSRASQ